jgi:hypothetical protein
MSELEHGVLPFISRELEKKTPRLDEVREAFNFYVQLQQDKGE